MWSALIWPILLIITALANPNLRSKFQRADRYLELAICSLVVLTTFVILIISYAAEMSQTTDIERLGGCATRCEHYEAWNERVQCRHPIYDTETYRDSNGRVQTRQVFRGYEHAYDVDYHPEYWVMNTTLANITVSESTYNDLITRWGKPQYRNMHRNYHSIDGDMYYIEWDGDYGTMEPVFVEHTWENRTQTTNTVFKFREIDNKTTPVYDYPPLNGWSSNNVLGPHNNEAISREYEKLNAMVGINNQCHVWVCTWVNQPQSVGLDQQQYWKGGNKNELVITISTDDNNRPQWAYVFSWMDNQELSYRIRDTIMAQDSLDLIGLNDYLSKEIPTRWKRKEFSANAPDKGYSYIDVDTPTWVILLAHLITIVGCAIVVWFMRET